MPKYRRFYNPNSMVFITVNTQKKIPYFENQRAIEIFFHTLNNVVTLYPIEVLAYVLLPDHFHWILQLKDNFHDFSRVMHSLKRNCTVQYKKEFDIKSPFTLWQGRFWDHVVRNEIDLETHMKYIHWNPVKHGYVSSLEDFPYSSFHSYVERGMYSIHWKCVNDKIRNLDLD